jgi:hypothetical protein
MCRDPRHPECARRADSNLYRRSRVEDEIPDKARNRMEAMDAETGFNLSEEDKLKAALWADATKQVFAQARAVVNDGSQYYAELLTCHNFGCVLHQSS